MPIIHDQHANADRLQYMHMAPDSVPIAALFPNKRKKPTVPLGASFELRTASARKHAWVTQVEFEIGGEPMKAHAEGEVEVEVIAAAVAIMRRRLQWSCTPAHRLRCGCYGRDLRSKQSENGLKNVREVVMKELRLEMEGRKKNDAAEKERNREKVGDKEGSWCTVTEVASMLLIENRETGHCLSLENTNSKSGTESDSEVTREYPMKNREAEAETAFDCDDEQGGAEWQELGNSMRFATHHLTAPAETSFLFNEVFVQRAYLQHGIRLAENDLVIDVGALINLIMDLNFLLAYPWNATIISVF